MPSQRNPWTGSMYAIAAVALIAATYFVPRHLEITPRVIGSLRSDPKQELLTSSLPPAPDGLVPVAGGELFENSALQSKLDLEKPISASEVGLEVPPIEKVAAAREEVEGAKPAKATIRAKPIVTDTSVVADN
ncbi:MAG: hypothetical protein AAGH89_16385 [Verrucomicrobiota bacterium]